MEKESELEETRERLRFTSAALNEEAAARSAAERELGNTTTELEFVLAENASLREKDTEYQAELDYQRKENADLSAQVAAFEGVIASFEAAMRTKSDAAEHARNEAKALRRHIAETVAAHEEHQQELAARLEEESQRAREKEAEATAAAAAARKAEQAAATAAAAAAAAAADVTGTATAASSAGETGSEGKSSKSGPSGEAGPRSSDGPRSRSRSRRGGSSGGGSGGSGSSARGGGGGGGVGGGSSRKRGSRSGGDRTSSGGGSHGGSQRRRSGRSDRPAKAPAAAMKDGADANSSSNNDGSGGGSGGSGGGGSGSVGDGRRGANAREPATLLQVGEADKKRGSRPQPAEGRARSGSESSSDSSVSELSSSGGGGGSASSPSSSELSAVESDPVASAKPTPIDPPSITTTTSSVANIPTTIVADATAGSGADKAAQGTTRSAEDAAKDAAHWKGLYMMLLREHNVLEEHYEELTDQHATLLAEHGDYMSAVAQEYSSQLDDMAYTMEDLIAEYGSRSSPHTQAHVQSHGQAQGQVHGKLQQHQQQRNGSGGRGSIYGEVGSSGDGSLMPRLYPPPKGLSPTSGGPEVLRHRETGGFAYATVSGTSGLPGGSGGSGGGQTRVYATVPNNRAAVARPSGAAVALQRRLQKRRQNAKASRSARSVRFSGSPNSTGDSYEAFQHSPLRNGSREEQDEYGSEYQSDYDSGERRYVPSPSQQSRQARGSRPGGYAPLAASGSSLNSSNGSSVNNSQSGLLASPGSRTALPPSILANPGSINPAFFTSPSPHAHQRGSLITDRYVPSGSESGDDDVELPGLGYVGGSGSGGGGGRGAARGVESSPRSVLKKNSRGRGESRWADSRGSSGRSKPRVTFAA